MRCVREEYVLNVFPNFAVKGTAEGREGVESGLREDREVGVDRRKGGEAIVGGEYGEVKGFVADGYCRPWGLGGSC